MEKPNRPNVRKGERGGELKDDTAIPTISIWL